MRSQITVHPYECLPEHSGYTTQYSDECGDEPDFRQCGEVSIVAALATGHLNADQALWLHDHRRNWQIFVEQRERIPPMRTITLDDIRREATLLEFDLHITDDDCLDLRKRGDVSLFYHSTQTIENERALQEAWQWLQKYRTSLRHLDAVRAQLANQQSPRPSRLGSILVPVLPALVLGSIIGVNTHNLWLGIAAYVVISGAICSIQCLLTRLSPR